MAYDPSNAEIIYVFYQEHSLDYWKLHFLQDLENSWAVVLGSLAGSTRTKENKSRSKSKTNRSQANFEEHIESIIARADAKTFFNT